MLRNFRERDDAISPFPRKSTPVLLESNVFQAGFPYFATHRRGLNYCPLSHLFAAADHLSRTLPRRSGSLLAPVLTLLYALRVGRAQGCGQEATI
jgi:hypothetical protein